MNAVTIKNLTKTYKDGTQALKGIDLEIKQGDFFALLGANGAGKTTAIGILTGLVNKTSGEASVFEHNIDTAHPQAKKVMGVVPQEMNFNQFEKAIDILMTQAGYCGIRRKDALEHGEFLLRKLDLWEKRNIQSRGLSGGMKRRLMIARALITKPRLLILDEPTAGVDVELRQTMWGFIRELNATGTTILLTTHYLEEVEQLCRNAAMIKDGKIIANDSVKNLMKQIDTETYIISVDTIKNLASLKKYNPRQQDDHSFEVDVQGSDEIMHILNQITKTGMTVSDFRPRGNRMEKLFLKLLNS